MASLAQLSVLDIKISILHLVMSFTFLTMVGKRAQEPQLRSIEQVETVPIISCQKRAQRAKATEIRIRMKYRPNNQRMIPSLRNPNKINGMA